MSNQNEGSITYDLTNFTIHEVTECGRAVRPMGVGAASMDAVAGRIVNYLCDTLIDGHIGERAGTQIRFFKTQAYADLERWVA